VANKTFDYVIIGGGTAGLVLAARLSEDPEVTVCVLEAGDANLNESGILVPAQYGRLFGNPQYDWGFSTVAQTHANNAIVTWLRGKGLGGSSAINFAFYHRPPAFDIDAFERLGNPGWNWDRFLEYSKRVETFQPPTPEEVEKYNLHYNAEYHGSNGPLRVGFSSGVSPSHLVFQETFNNLDIETQKDNMNGNLCGTWMGLATLDKDTGNRSYSANAYYAPNASRQNLKVLTGASAHRLLFAPAEQPEGVKATGVEFIHDKNAFEVQASKEVILSAGTLKSPQILELSGIGDPSILKPLDIDVRVDLPGIGSNMQEHVLVGVTFELENPDQWETRDASRSEPESAREQFATFASAPVGANPLARGAAAFVPLKTINVEAAEAIIASITSKLEKQDNPAVREQWALQLEAIKDENTPDCEFVTSLGYIATEHAPDTKKMYFTVVAALNHPFSRGNMHITSNNPEDHAAMDPHIFEQDEDALMLLEMMKFVRRLPETEPFKSMVAKELNPGAEFATDEDLMVYIKKYLSSVWHTAGTCSMLPQDKGGVVDSRLKVYGTTNVRVVDLSVIPLHVMAHTQATVYALAEQAADIIKGVI